MNKPPAPLFDALPADVSADKARAWLSALADGQPDAAQPACASWRDDPAARQTWHAYHLIGDVLRSEELAREPARDAAFLARLRERLATEPVVLAPKAPAVRQRSRQPWLLPAAAAAGFAAVAGVVVLLQLGTPGAPPAGVLAGTSGPGLTAVSTVQGTLAGTATGLGAVPTTAVRAGSDGFIRDPRLDEYLRAHQAARSGVAAAAPGGLLRRVDAAAPAAGVQR